jgi:hypothetical protein
VSNLPATIDDLQQGTGLPAELWSGIVGYEFRLRGPQRVDFGFGLDKGGSSVRTLAEWLPDRRLAEHLMGWSAGRHPLARITRHISVEFDRGSGVKLPSLFLERAPQLPGAFQSRPDALIATLADLQGSLPDPELAVCLVNAISQQPPGCTIDAIGLLLQRPELRVMRIVSGASTASHCMAYVVAFASAVQSERVADLLSRCPLADARLGIARDIGVHSTGQIGLEIGPRTEWFVPNPDAWDALADWLQAEGLADVDTSAVLRAEARSVDGRVRGPAHVKVVVTADGDVDTIKGYVGIGPAPSAD